MSLVVRAADLLDFSRAAVDSSHIRAMKGGPATGGPSPVDRGKAGCKHRLIVDAHGILLAVITTGGNRSDVTRLILLIQAVPSFRRSAAGAAGHCAAPSTCTPSAAMTTRSTGTRSVGFQITPHLARRGTGHGFGLGVYRWVVEGAIALPHCFAACVSAGRSATTSTTRSSPSAAPSSAGDGCAPHCAGSEGRRCA